MIKQVIAALLVAASWAPAVQAQDGGRERQGDSGAWRMERQGRGDRQADRPDRQQQPPAYQPPAYQRPAYQPPVTPEAAQARGNADDWRQRRAERQQGQQRFDQQAQPQGQPHGDRQRRDRGGDDSMRGQADGRDNRDVRRSPGGEWRRDDAGRSAPYANGQGGRYGGSDQRRGGYDQSRSGDDARNGRTQWNRGWRGDGRYDWSEYRQGNRSAFRLPRYYAPSNWNGGYRRFSIGITLSSQLWGQNYWIEEPAYYRLPPAYGPYRWVRYYNDALLIDIRSGYVVDTVYDIFW